MEVVVREILKCKQTLPRSFKEWERKREEKGREKSFNKMIDPKAVRLYYCQYAGSSGSTDVDLIYLVRDQI